MNFSTNTYSLPSQLSQPYECKLFLSVNVSSLYQLTSFEKQNYSNMNNENSVQNNQICIDVAKPYELWDWADKLKVSADSLKQAVLEVGGSLNKVRAYLKK